MQPRVQSGDITKQVGDFFLQLVVNVRERERERERESVCGMGRLLSERRPRISGTCVSHVMNCETASRRP